MGFVAPGARFCGVIGDHYQLHDIATRPAMMLAVVKTAHTLVWGFFVGCIAAIWALAGIGWLRCAAIFIGIVFIEVMVLAVNQFRCPLTAIAARYTDDSRANFDIYLPETLAKHTKIMFGSLYVGGAVFTMARWRFMLS